MSKEINRICFKGFEAYTSAFMSKHQVPGAVVALASPDEVIYCRAFGYRDREQSLPTTTDTLFGVTSITKSFTALAIGLLVQQGRLTFDDPVSKYLPDFRLPGGNNQGVTIRHLLTHTSGLPALDALQRTFREHSSNDPGEQYNSSLSIPPINTYPQLIKYIANYPSQPLGAPGEYFNYSNEGYALLGAIVRRASGIPYASFVRKHIFEPLGMLKTTYSFEEMYEHDEVTVLYTRKSDDSLQPSTRWPCAPAFQAAGRIKSTAEDLIRLFQLFLGQGSYRDQSIVSPQLIAEATTPHFRHALHESYGHALHIHPDFHGVTLLSHGGAGKGISAHGGFVPERSLAAVVLTNLSGIPAGQLWGALINTSLGLPVDTPRNEYTLSAWSDELSDRYCGQYASAEGNEFAVCRCGGDLVLRQKQGDSVISRVVDDVGVYYEGGREQEIRFYVDRVTNCTLGALKGVRFIPRVN